MIYRKNISSSKIAIGILVFLVIFTLFSGQALAANEATISRSISQDAVNPGDTFTVTITLTTNQELVTIGLKEILPSGWTATEKDSGSFTFSPSNNEWIWTDIMANVPSGTSTSVTYDVKVPDTATAGSYSVTGSLLGKNTPANGGTDIEITTSGDAGITIGNTDGVDSAPVLDPIGAKSASVNSLLSFAISATDADGDAITYAATGLPAGATFNAATATFSWTPSAAGTYDVTFTATANGQTDSESVRITVGSGTSADQAPELNSIGARSVNVNSLLSFSISATDANGDLITYSASGLPSGATFDAATATFSWTPSTAGTYDVTFTANANGKMDSETVKITVLTSSVDKTGLAAAITAANVKAGAAVAGTEAGQYPQSAIDTFKAAINAAQTVAVQTSATQAEVNQAITDLAAAEATFDASMIRTGDLTPPSPVTNLKEIAVGSDQISWTWTNPSDADFSHVMVYLDGVLVKNTADSSINFYNATELTGGVTYTIGICTVDTSGNINSAAVNDSATTVKLPTISGLSGTNISSSSITLVWSASDDTATVQVRRDNLVLGNVSGVTSYVDNGLNSRTTYRYTLVPYDSNGIEGKAVTVSLRTSSSGSSGGGSSGGSSSSKSSSSGGGGGASSVEDFANVAMKDVDIAVLQMNANVTYEFMRPGNDILSISLYSLKNSGEVTSTIEVLKNRSKLVNSTPEGLLYKYINIWVGKSGFATTANIKDMQVRFKVNSSLIQEMGVDPADIVLQRYDGASWEVLPTTLENTTADHAIFGSRTTGFGPFAITAGKTLASVTNTTDTKLPAANAGDLNDPASADDIGTKQTQAEKSNTPVVIMFVLLIVVAIGGYAYLRKQ